MNKKQEFSKLYDHHIAKIYRFVYLKVDSKETAEDLTSEVFMRAWMSYSKILNPKSEVRNPSAFLYQVARNVIADHYRKKGSVQVISIEDTVITSPESLHEQASLRMDIDDIKKAIQQLSTDYQDLIIWRYIDELSVAEIAELTGKTEENVRVSVHRALQSLKSRFLTV